jgi:prevent-host-death family protein
MDHDPCASAVNVCLAGSRQVMAQGLRATFRAWSAAGPAGRATLVIAAGGREGRGGGEGDEESGVGARPTHGAIVTPKEAARSRCPVLSGDNGNMCSMMSTNHKGAIAELKIATAALELGVPVLRPIQEHARYDLAFEIGGRIWRVQCKWASCGRDPAVVSVALRTSWHTPKGYVRQPYAHGEIDLVAAYCGERDECYLLPSALVVGRTEISLRLTPPRNGQRASVHLASEYLFAGAVAQLEERRHGMAEARGSNPLSSTSLSGGPRVVPVGCNEFRMSFGFYLERAAAGDEIHISRHGKPFARLLPPLPAQPTVMPA